MAKLLVQAGGQTTLEIRLRPGSNRIGRSIDADFQIVDASISSEHCEIILDGETIRVRDLGSTNGTFINGTQIREASLQPEQILRLGNVEIFYPLEQKSPPIRVNLPAAKESAPSNTGLRVAIQVEPSAPPIIPHETIPTARAYLSAPVRDYESFFQRLPSAFAYPFKRNGVMLMVSGTAFFAFLNFMLTGPSTPLAFLYGPLMVGLFIVWLLSFGYLSAYLQKIVVTSAQGEDDLPSWPEFSNWWDDIIHPALLTIGSFVASLCPLLLLLYFGGELDPNVRLVLGLACGIFGCAYLPMALLATAMYDTIFALNPLLIVPSMAKIPKEHFVACITLGAIVLLKIACDFLLQSVPLIILPPLVTGFLSLYFFCVEMRILGLIYNSKQDELNWSF